ITPRVACTINDNIDNCFSVGSATNQSSPTRSERATSLRKTKLANQICCDVSFGYLENHGNKGNDYERSSHSRAFDAIGLRLCAATHHWSSSKQQSLRRARNRTQDGGTNQHGNCRFHARTAL